MNCDYIIIGAGSAGCVVANKLTLKGFKVVLIEAGGWDNKLFIQTPIGYGMTFTDERVNWAYNAEPDPGLGNRGSYMPRGKIIGGSSSINAMVYCRGIAGDYDDWQTATNGEWGYDHVKPIFESFERRVDVDGNEHGQGALYVSKRDRDYHPITKHFLASCAQAGLPITDNMNCDNPVGFGHYEINTKHGWRCSSAKAFLHPIKNHPNIRIITNALVEKILMTDKTASGVAYYIGNQRFELHCAREVILSAGAFGTPQILQLSGIGAGALCQQMGIENIMDNPNVGRHLQDHLGINYYYRANIPTLNQDLGTWAGRIKNALLFGLFRTGAFSLSVNQMGGMVKSDESLARPDTQLYLNPLSYSGEYNGKRLLLKPDAWAGFILSFNPCRPQSRGHVAISSPDFRAHPKIHPNYLSHPDDIANVLASARLIGRIQETPALKNILSAPPKFDVHRATDEQILTDFRARSGTVFHPSCTARMAKNANDGVVDARGRVFGIANLRIADASIFPNITSANTNAPAILVGHKIADFIANY